MSVPRGDAREIARGPRAKTRRRALRLYRDWEEELAANEIGRPHLSPTKALELEEALRSLHGRHDGLAGEARRSPAPPTLSAAAAAKVHAKRGAARASETIGEGADAASEAAGRAGRYAYRHSGAEGAVRDWTRTSLQLLGAMAGVALLYLILTSATRRRGAGGSLPDALEAGAAAFRRFFSPRTDLLGGGSATRLAGAAAAVATFDPGASASGTAGSLLAPGVRPSPRAFGDVVFLRGGPAAPLVAPPSRAGLSLGGPLQLRRPRRPAHR